MVQHAERSHAKWNSSGAHRWTICLGQPNLAATLPAPPSSKHALDGTAAHEILQMCVEGAVNGVPAEPHKFTNSPEVIRSVSVVLDYLARLRAEYPDLILETERRVWFPQDRVPEQECGGTLDLFAYSPSTGEAWIIDFKHGAGVAVEVVGNKQLLSYATARLWREAFAKATLVVIQPRAEHRLGPVRDWEITVVDMVEFVAEIDDVLRQGSKPDAPLVAGDHCRWCPCVNACPERDRHALAGMQQDFKDVRQIDAWQPPAPKDIPIDKLLLIRRNAPQIRQWLEGVDDYLTTAAIHGNINPADHGLKLVEAQARRKWDANEERVAAEIMALSGHTLAIDDVRPRKLRTITELTAELVRIATANVPHGWKDKAAETMRERIAMLTTKESSGNLVLVDDTDKRPSTSLIAKQFGEIASNLIPPPTAPAAQQMMYGALPAPPVDPATLINKD